jgi:hypothetical protein
MVLDKMERIHVRCYEIHGEESKFFQPQITRMNADPFLFNSFRHSPNGSSLPSDGRRNLFCGTISQGSPEWFRSNLGLNDSIPLGLVLSPLPKVQTLAAPATDWRRAKIRPTARRVCVPGWESISDGTVHHPIQIFQRKFFNAKAQRITGPDCLRN